MLIPIWNFERKLKIMLNLCYLLHLFRILAITCSSKFQLIRNWWFLKGNSIHYNFHRNRKIQSSTFSRPKMQFKLLLKIMTFSEHFFFLNFFKFLNFLKFFHGSYLQNFFKRANKMPLRKTFFIISFKKWNKMKSNKKSHLINFKLILMRTNQN